MPEKKADRPGLLAGYGLWAETCDATPNPVVAVDRVHTLDLLDARPGETVLDAGCGAGRHPLR